MAVVAIAPPANALFESFFYDRDHKASLIRVLHEQAEAAAAKIGQFVGTRDNSLAGFHLKRLLNGAKGIRMQLE